MEQLHLNLPRYTLVNYTHHDTLITATVRPDAPLVQCVHCTSQDVVRFGGGRLVVADIPRRKQQVQLTILRQRYRCRGCRRTSLQPLVGVDARRRATKRLLRYIEYQCRTTARTNVDLAHAVGLTEGTIRSIMRDYRSSHTP